MNNIATEYTTAMIEYEKQLEGAYKKSNGIFYTDLSLASKILEELDVFEFSTVLDPCCGTGSFIIASIKKGIKNIFGADHDKNAITICNSYVNKANIKVADTIGNDGVTTLKKLKTGGKVDFVIGNPPYAPLIDGIYIKASDYVFLRKVSDSGNNLFVAALLRAFELVKQGGVISYIIPKNFLHVASYSLLRREILRGKTIVSIIDIGAYFKNVRGEQIILTIKNSVSSNNFILIKKLIDNQFINMSSVEQNFFTDEILLFNSEHEFSIYKKMKSSYQILKDVCTGYVGRGRATSNGAVAGKDIRKFGYKNIPLPESGNRVLVQNIYGAEAGIIAALGGDLDAAETVTVFTDDDEKMCRYILGILHSRL
ncbi:MAG: N-6 DNA methylase, partial [Atribacterota bacterium]|nr:N-6 DNA methylase [Atribacterota bacterium]